MKTLRRLLKRMATPAPAPVNHEWVGRGSPRRCRHCYEIENPFTDQCARKPAAIPIDHGNRQAVPR